MQTAFIFTLDTLCASLPEGTQALELLHQIMRDCYAYAAAAFWELQNWILHSMQHLVSICFETGDISHVAQAPDQISFTVHRVENPYL